MIYVDFFCEMDPIFLVCSLEGSTTRSTKIKSALEHVFEVEEHQLVTTVTNRRFSQ